MKLLIGNFKGPEGKQGKEGAQGKTGETGARGSRWTSGTAVTGTSTIGTKFPDSNITDARLYDYYVNTDTGNLYECIVAGTADVAEWVHIGNLKGPKGDTGPEGSISNINDQKPTYEEAEKLENITSGETVKATFGKLKKAISVLISHYMQKATASILGHVKLSDSAAVTIAGEYALDAIEKNASIDGTLANLIAQQNSNLTDGVVNLQIISTLTVPTQLKHSGFYNFPAIDSDVNNNIADDAKKMTDYAYGDYSGLLISNSITSSGCQFGVLMVTSPRLLEKGICAWFGLIWNYKFTLWKKL